MIKNTVLTYQQLGYTVYYKIHRDNLDSLDPVPHGMLE